MSHELCNRPRSPKSLCGSVVEYRNANSKGRRFDSSWELRICSLSHAREKHQFQSDLHSNWQLDDLQSHRRLLWDQWHCGTLHAQQVTQLLMQSQEHCQHLLRNHSIDLISQGQSLKSFHTSWYLLNVNNSLSEPGRKRFLDPSSYT